ncbi:SNF2-related protein [Chryseobacterium indologenes]|uniref:Eco57I restriction-modification methylase domain-containing protein n=1 Tax=Chryseobacterium indologenes TaxID=253 RepID=UPI002D7F863E|nr:SNF2-related protein [Chryseobacterium indologenes]MEB4760190.1 SNF2-related protein [Chryseobacterium indologenes]
MSDDLEINDDITVIEGSKNELILFAKNEDAKSFQKLLELNAQSNSRTLVILNAAINSKRFLNRFQNFDGKIFLCLEANRIGDAATLKILMEFKENNIKDIRKMYDISANGNKDLSQYLQNKLDDVHKNSNLVTSKESENAATTTKPNGISDTQHLESGSAGRDSGKPLQDSQSEQTGNNATGQNVGSSNAGNGSSGAERSNLAAGERGRGSADKTQPQHAEEKPSVGRIVFGRIAPNTGRSDKQVHKITTNVANAAELDGLISKYKGQKLTNQQVAEVASAACFISESKELLYKDGITITDELKDICNQFKSGGVAKEGRGILDEYYTDQKIVEAVRNLIKEPLKNRKEISVLEPSVGTGNFLYAVKGLSSNTTISAFEINETTARIAKILHPEATINLRSFESEFIDEKGNKKELSQQYDLVIGNPPYGEHRGLYKGLGEEPKLSKYEDYFVKRSLDVLKDDGVLAMVLPSGWLNRKKDLEDAELLKAFRLPTGAFAGTQIGTDIVILKKSSQIIKHNISDYFEKNPENILGEIREKSNRFGRMELYVHGTLDDALARLQRLETNKQTERIGNLFEDLLSEPPKQTVNQHSIPLQNKDKTESISEGIADPEKNDVSYNEVREKIETVLSKLNTVKFKSPAVLKEIDKYKKLQSEIEEQPGKFSKDRINEILKKADRFISSHKDKNTEYRVQTKPELKKGILKYLFSKADDIVNTSLQNSSDITQEQIDAFRDTNYDGTLNNYGKHYQFANYMNGNWVHDFYYGEGNIYSKLEQLEIDFKDKLAVGGTEDQYNKQLNLLLNVLPKPKTFDEIFISPNHEFVHQFALGQVEKERYNYNTKSNEVVVVDYNLAEKFKDFVGTLSSDAFQGSSAWEVRQFVDNETVTGSDKERNALVRDRRKAAANDLFQKFIREDLSDDLRERFVKDFNRNYNNIHVPAYSKFPLFSKIYKNFKGNELRLTEVQKAGIGRLTTKGVGLLAHEVGFGKTLSGILSMHEAMERGNSRRPLIVVPNDSILKQWVETIFETIPDAKVNVLGNLGKDYDLSKFDNKDGEITIVTYEGFNNIGFSESITQDLASKFSYISESELRSVNSISERDFQKELEKGKEIEGKMKRGKIYDWEDFGFDHITFDEVHNANHIVGKVRTEDRRFSSDFRSQNQQTSKLGINTWMAAQYIQEKYDGRNVTLLSATPFTNKPLEYYSILSLIANKRLEESGYFNVNTFFETFMETDTDMEIDAKGDVKFKANVRRFKNNSLFQQLLSEFIDIKGEEDNPELIRPNKINKEYKIEQNELTREQYDLLTENFSETEKGAILTHILNARLIAISPYLSPYYEGEFPSVEEFIENSPKLNETMNLIRQNKKDIPDAGQIIYSELAVSEFPRMKEYLVTNIGYKPDEIGIITGATSKPQRISIQNDFNSGKIKIIIGSEAIQEGMNLQENTTDLYLLSLPYNFTTLRQVEGRAWRQGNKHENVRVNFMLTNDSIDVFMLQKLQSKQARYLEAMKKGSDVLDISDISTQELKTSIITNPETRANIEIELLKKKIESEKNKHLADIAFVLRKQEDFLKVKEMVTKAEQSYNRILGYSQSEDENTDYWKNQLPVYQKSIDNAKAEVQKTIELLSEKGVSVVEIETQTKNTEDKIAELDKRLESLEVLKLDLVNLYKNEKEERLLSNQHKNYFDERAFENEVLYKSLNRKDFKNNMSSNLPLKKEDHNLSRVISTNRKR